MYRPQGFPEFELDAMHGLVRAYPLGTLVRQGPAGLAADHLPFILESERGPHGYLLGHVARANSMWKELGADVDVMVVFRGPDGYVSPNWYPSKQETHRHVPTWNYQVVHAHGRARVREDETFIRGVVARLTRSHESGETRPWRMSDAERDYLNDQLRQIVGIEIELTRVEGKSKLSQNRDDRDFEGVVRALERDGRSDLATAMRRARPER